MEFRKTDDDVWQTHTYGYGRDIISPSDAYLKQRAYYCKPQQRYYEDMYHNTIDYKVKKYINDKLDILMSFIRKMKCDII